MKLFLCLFLFYLVAVPWLYGAYRLAQIFGYALAWGCAAGSAAVVLLALFYIGRQR